MIEPWKPHRSILKFTSQHCANVYVVSWIDVTENRHVGRRSHLRPKDILAEVTFPPPQCSRIYRACAVTCNGLSEYAHCRRSSQLFQSYRYLKADLWNWSGKTRAPTWTSCSKSQELNHCHWQRILAIQISD